MDILSIGFAVCDMIVHPVTPDLFCHDSTKVDLKLLPGGDACNVAVNAAALGMRTGIVTAVGDDANGIFLKDFFVNNNVDISGIKTVSATGTGVSIVMVEPSGERHFLTNNAVYNHITPDQITDDMLDGLRVLSINSCYRMDNIDYGGIVPVFEKARRAGTLTAMDTTWNRKGDWLESIEATLAHTDIFLPSFHEAAMLTGTNDILQMRDFMRRFDMKIFGVKLGEKGSYVTDFSKEYWIPPFITEDFQNTIGAGDSYFAGFITAQAKGMTLYDSAVFASAVASFTVRSEGAVGGVPSFDEIIAFIHSQS